MSGRRRNTEVAILLALVLFSAGLSGILVERLHPHVAARNFRKG